MNKPMGAGIAVGIAIGVALGAALDNIGVGIAIGIALGVAIDQLSMVRNNTSDKNSDPVSNSEANLHSAQNNPVNAARSAEKDAHVAQVLVAVRERGSITNHDVQELIGVSDATAERYLEELEKSGAIAQLGKTGNAVSYKAL